MSDNSVKSHYENLLAKHYSWMFGDFDQQVDKNRSWFQQHDVQPRSGKKALDLGCGSGFQSLALSQLGFDVTAVDFNQDLLDELTNHDENGAIETVHSDILKTENYDHQAPFELAVCMGDTLPHLPSEDAVSTFLQRTHTLLEPNGKLALSFRDYSFELSGKDRFIPVQNDSDKIMTVFLEYDPDYVWVHDLVYERKGDDWELYKSVYKKVRLSAGKVEMLLEKANFQIKHMQTAQGMVHLIAEKC